MVDGALPLFLEIFLALLVVAAIIDVRTFTIANRLNLTVAGLAPLYWLATGLPLWPQIAVQVAIAAGVFLLLAGAFYAGLMGRGDVKLAAALALWFSPASTLRFLVFMSLVVAAPLPDRRRHCRAWLQGPGHLAQE
ncbi:MAG: prepilin peptidase [Sphingomonas sp.]|nr:prepilin peptidase [Sphingomonas sp.]